MATGRDLHIDVPLSNLAIKAFNGGTGGAAMQLFPTINVDKQSNKYYTITKNSWLTYENDRRAPKTTPKTVEFDVSSDAYFCENYALAGEISVEDLSNADTALRLRENTTMNVVERLQRNLEIRVANQVTSITNVGSGVSLAGTAKWSDYTNSNPLSDVTTAISFIRNTTGLTPNVAVVDPDTFETLRRHPDFIDLFKYVEGGLLNRVQLTSILFPNPEDNGKIIIANGIRNYGVEGGVASIAPIWGNVCLFAHVNPNVLTPQTATFGIGFRWAPEGLPAMSVMRQAKMGAGDRKVEIVEAGYYQAEKIVGKELSYLIRATI